MNACNPCLYCPTIEDRKAAIRALYALGYRRDARSDVENGVAQVNVNATQPFLYVSQGTLYGNIHFGTDKHVKDDERCVPTNSLNHLIRCLKRRNARAANQS